MNEDNKLITRDWLAIERTKLANERTFLAYFRTFIVILGTGITLLKIEFFSDLKLFGWILIFISPVILLIGILRLYQVKKTIRNYYKN
jgi:putative membrane protein